MPSGIFKRIPRHIALLAAATVPLALAAGIVAIIYFRTAPSTPTIQSPASNLQNSPSLSASIEKIENPPAVPRITPPLRLDPSDVLAHAKTPDPALKAWLENWQTQWSNGHDPDAKQIAELNATLEKSSLGAEDLLALAHAFHHLSDDILTSARFYGAASLRIESELNKPGMSAEQSLPLLLAINQHIEDYKHVLWPMIEDRDDDESAKTLYRIYSNFVRWVPATNDSNLIAASRHPAIGAAECLYLLKRTKEAEDSLEKMPLAEMTAGEKTAHAWIYGLVLYRQHLYLEAVPQFKSVIDDLNFKYAKDAGRMLVASLAHTGDREGAKAALMATIKTHKYAAKEIVPLLALINMDAETR